MLLLIAEVGTTSLIRKRFRAAIRTAGAFPQLINYLLDEMFLEYNFNAHISSEFIEGRFGWYRQLLGPNYYNSVLHRKKFDEKYV